MSGWRIADDIFEQLFKKGYVTQFEWKNINRQTTRYTVSFFCEKCPVKALHIFEISVIGGVHYITETALNIFLVKHGYSLTDDKKQVGGNHSNN